MLQILFFYLVLPFILAAFVIRFIKKHGASQIPADVTALLAVDPVEKRFYRAARRDNGLIKLGDFETHEEAVDAIYAARKRAREDKLKAAFIVLNDKGETLDWIDS